MSMLPTTVLTSLIILILMLVTFLPSLAAVSGLEDMHTTYGCTEMVMHDAFREVFP